MLRVLSLGFTTREPHWAFAVSMLTAQHALLTVVLVDAHEAAVLQRFPFSPQIVLLQQSFLSELELPAYFPPY
jgi:hypothetical protein